jgi:hypothetical protein
MDWQFPLVLVFLALAVLYLARRTWRTWRGKGGGCGTCKCGTESSDHSTKLIPVEHVTLRSRPPR